MRKIIYTVLVSFLVMLFFSSCQNFIDYTKSQFPELSDSSQVRLTGEVIAPVVHSEMTLGDLLQKLSNDTTKTWIEVDSTGLLHLMMRHDSVAHIVASDLGFNVPVAAGQNIPEITIPDLKTQDFSLPTPKNLPGVLYFFDPKLTLFIENDLVINYDIIIKQINLTNSTTNQENSYDDTINIAVNKAVGGVPGRSTEVIDSSNFPQFPAALALMPDLLNFKFDIYIPSQQIDEALNLDQGVTIGTLFDIPLVFYAKDVMISDTANFALDLSKYDLIDSLSIDLKSIVGNGIPLGGRLYMILTDSSVIDTIGVIPAGAPDLVNDTISLVIGGKYVRASAALKFDPAEVDQYGNPINVTESISHIQMPQYMLENLRNFNLMHPGEKVKILIIAKFNTYKSDQGQVVRVYENNQLIVKLGAKINYDVAMSLDSLQNNN